MMVVRCWGLKVEGGVACLSDPFHFNADRLLEWGGRGSQAGLNDRALFVAVALVRVGSSPTIAGVTGPQRPGVRGLMSQY